ncbi:MAG: hypothetical protein M3Y87_17940 [Myxococcota bacterium]|nr:hypothetical protein [Myxococcota bacterium]
MRLEWWMTSMFLGIAACGGEPAIDPDAGRPNDAARSGDAGDVPGDAGDVPGDAGDLPSDAGDIADASVPRECDFRAEGGIVVIEAESLPLAADWARGTHADASGGEYIGWTGTAHNNDTSFGHIEVSIEITTPGLYRLQVRQRVGMGTNATEHNDSWMSFSDADAFYGIQGPATAEDRVYPRPRCEDATFLASIEAMADVTQASCPAGSSRDGYFKIYSSGALEWRWSARTSDSDAHDVVARFDAPGVYTYRIAARADHAQLDRIVLHEIGLANSVVQDLTLAETRCP